MDLTRNTAGRFWLLQAAGWSIYALDRYLSEQSFFPFYFIYLCIAFALTSVVLRPLLSRRLPTAPGAPGIARCQRRRIRSGGRALALGARNC
jgi:hypothetical protein